MLNRTFLAFSLALLVCATAASASRPLVSLVFSADASIPPQVARSVSSEAYQVVTRELGWRLTGSGASAELHYSSKPPLRHEIVRRAREAGADLGIDIRFHEVQRSRHERLAFASAWVVSADSGAYYGVTETAWTTTDSMATRRRISLLLRRLLPVQDESGCFAVVSELNRPRGEGGEYLGASATIAVYTTDNVPAAGVPLRGHWTVNYRTKVPFELVTDENGTADVSYQPPEGLHVNDIATPTVSWVACPFGTFDQQWPQRQVDQAVAILENARADLDEDRDYDSAIERAERFLDLRPDVIHWYDLVMTSPMAVDRRVQARYLLRRAEAEKERAGAAGTATRGENMMNWMFGLSGGYYGEILKTGKIDAEPVGSDAGDPVTIRRGGAAAAGLELTAKYRTADPFWLGVGCEIWRMRVKSSLDESVKRTVIHLVGDMDLWVPIFEEREFTFYLNGSARLNRYSTSDDNVYWVYGVPRFEPGSGTAFEEPGFEGLHGGLGVGCGLMSRATEWMPLYWSLELALGVDGIPGGLTQKSLAVKAALSFRN